MKKFIILSAFYSGLTFAASTPSIDDFANSEKLRNDYKEQCKGYSIFVKDKYPEVCFNWSEGTSKSLYNKPLPDFSNIKFKKKVSPNAEIVKRDVISFLQSECQMNENKSLKTASSSFKTKNLTATLDRLGEEKYKEKLSEIKCSHFKPLF